MDMLTIALLALLAILAALVLLAVTAVLQERRHSNVRRPRRRVWACMKCGASVGQSGPTGACAETVSGIFKHFCKRWHR